VVSKQRVRRIAERIHEDLSEMLIHEVSDPRLVGISVSDVRVDRELAFADIYVSALEGSERADEIIDGLEHASGFLRSELASRVELRTFPQLRFHWDPSFERAERIEQLIASLHDESSPKNSKSLTEEHGEDDLDE
jgi:ribosome-binding factor A